MKKREPAERAPVEISRFSSVLIDPLVSAAITSGNIPEERFLHAAAAHHDPDRIDRDTLVVLLSHPLKGLVQVAGLTSGSAAGAGSAAVTDVADDLALGRGEVGELQRGEDARLATAPAAAADCGDPAECGRLHAGIRFDRTAGRGVPEHPCIKEDNAELGAV